MEIKPYGDRGVLLAQLDESERQALLAGLAAELPRGCEEFVLGYDSILLVGQGIWRDFQSSAAEDTFLRAYLKQVLAGETVATTPSRCHVVEVLYDGIDLASVARACQLTEAQVIELHTAPTYTVRMMGFSPGFPYLEGLDSRLHLARRSSPRNHIEPGTVAIGGSHAGIYTVASPGGWHLLGRTDLPLFNLDQAQQANPQVEAVFGMAVGDRVRFKAKALS